MTQPIILWFRQDLRIADNPALVAAVAQNRPILPIYILEEPIQAWSLGGASRWWLHHSLSRLMADLATLDAPLLLLRGDPGQIIPELVQRVRAIGVLWNRRYEPHAIARDKEIRQELQKSKILVESYNSALLFEPWTIQTQAGQAYKVFTPYWRACLAKGQVDTPLAAPHKIIGVKTLPVGLALDDLCLLPRQPDWASGLRQTWTPGATGAKQQLTQFLRERLKDYTSLRDRPDVDGSSRLSPHLHFGEISPRQIWHAAQTAALSAQTTRGLDTFLKELGWREFNYHLLFHFPHLPEQNFRPEFNNFPSQEDPSIYQAWSQGRTGYPIVDAGMRQLWHTGWMHNRVRMIAASVLVKHLLQPWQVGAYWFWDTLVDADLANNSASWQWVAGCGADAAPYFRIFNPVLQGIKFDPEGAYVRQWVPELAKLPFPWIHKPWLAPPQLLEQIGLRIGQDYPAPIIDPAVGRARALAAFANMSK